MQGLRQGGAEPAGPPALLTAENREALPAPDYIGAAVPESTAMALKGKCTDPLMFPPYTVWKFPQGLVAGGMATLKKADNLDEIVHARVQDVKYVAQLWPIIRLLLHTNVQNHYWTAEVLTTLVLSAVLLNTAEAGWSAEETYVTEKGK